MGVNQYSQPAQHKFINTYVPVPFSELSNAAAARQGKYDENVARVDNAQLALNQMDYIPNSQDQRTVEQWQRELSTFADEFIDQDYSDPEVYRKIKSGIKQIVDPAKAQQIQQSAGGWRDYMKQSASMQAKGQQVYNPQDFTGYNTLDPSQGIFAGQPMMDLGAQAEQAINKFMTKPELDWREINLPSGRIGTEHFRDVNKINDLINSGEFGQLINAPAIQQLMEREGMDEAGFKSYLQELAPSYEQAKLTSASFPPVYGKTNNPTTPPRVTFQQQGVVNQGGKDILGIGKAPKFDGNGNIKANANVKSEWIRATGPAGETINTLEGPEQGGINPNDIERTAKIVEHYPMLGRDGKATSQQIWEGYEQIMSEFNQIATPSVKLTAAQRIAWGGQLADGLVDQHMELRDSRGVSEVTSTVNDNSKGSVMHELGWNPSEFKSALGDPSNKEITVSNFAIGDGSEPGQIILNVADKKRKNKGQIRKVYISTNMGMAEEVQGLSDLYGAVSTGSDQMVFMGYDEQGRPIAVQNIPNFTYDDKWNYQPNLKMGPITIDPATGEPVFAENAADVTYRQVTGNIL